jgi:hypothetical protein|tara:strand:- start:12329 stop:12589 length:261 start_codon:yes stop_codon:yes gene_type:complete
MTSNRFKVSIPPGSLLDEELKGLSGRERNSRLYFLAELGALIESRNRVEPVKKSKQNDKVDMEAAKSFTETTLFDHDDLLQLSGSG